MKMSRSACGTVIIHILFMFSYKFSGMHIEKFSKPDVGAMQIRN
jgi:hypothetical protein